MPDTDLTQNTDLSIGLRGNPGSSPGTLLIDADAVNTTLRVIQYDGSDLAETTCDDPRQLHGVLRDHQGILWVDATGLGSHAALVTLGEVFGIHRLALEDMVNVDQRPKCEEYADQLFVVMRIPVGTNDTEQFSLLLGRDFVLTLQERPTDCLDGVRDRIRHGKGRIRAESADYLTYAILDAITDAYFPLIEKYGEKLEELEEEALAHPTIATLTRIRSLKRELMFTRRTIWSTRELFNTMLRDSVALIGPSTRVYLRDCYDHAVQLLDITENYRELAFGLMDVYLSATSNRMNEIMKVLTIVATVFIPLTFVAGVYGMNFDREASPWNMPELGWRYGYPVCVLLMATSGAGMLLYFRRLGWLGRRAAPRTEPD